MHNAVSDHVIAHHAERDEYSLRDNITHVVVPGIVSSKCDKFRHFEYRLPKRDDEVYKIEQEQTRRINTSYLERLFTQIPDDCKQLMNITPLLDEIAAHQVNAKSQVGLNKGNASYEFRRNSAKSGTIVISYTWQAWDEFGVLDNTDKETHEIPDVIYYHCQYYAITNAFIEFLNNPKKPQLREVLDRLLH
jgi:hypothetical protein